MVSEPAMIPVLQSLWEWQGVGNAPLLSESVEIGIASDSERAVAVATLLAPRHSGTTLNARVQLSPRSRSTAETWSPRHADADPGAA